MCDPDYNAWTEDINPKPSGEKTNLRSAGCHIHIGYDNPNVETSLQLIKLFDVYLGLASVVIDPDNKRRQLYGKAGAFRVQDWGVEYRTLSSYMYSSDMLMHVIWMGILRVINAFNSQYHIPAPGVLIPTINNSDYDEAISYLNSMSRWSNKDKEFVDLVLSYQYKNKK